MLLVWATAHKAANAVPAWHLSLVLSSFCYSAVWRAHTGPLCPFSHSVLLTGDISSLQMRKPVLRLSHQPSSPARFPCVVGKLLIETASGREVAGWHSQFLVKIGFFAWPFKEQRKVGPISLSTLRGSQKEPGAIV